MPKILVIEDEQDIRETIAEMLEFLDYDVVTSNDGAQGVKLARLHHPDLILCDIIMPNLDGYGVLMQLSADPKTVNIPIIFLTAKSMHEDIRRGMVLGADDYLTKPFSAHDLQEAVAARLERFDRVVWQGQHDLKLLREYLNLTLPHELRTPLTIISGYLDILQNGFDEFETDEVTSMLEKIGESAHRMRGVVENFVAYSQARIIRRDPELMAKLHEFSQTSAVQVLIEKQALQEATLAGREIDLSLNLQEGDVFFYVEHLRKVLSCLLINAFKFSPKGMPVQVTSRIESDSYIIQVRDFGRGMSAEEIDQIGENRQFERKLYEQQGVGLGLALAHLLAVINDGSLNIESSLGKYTAVTIRLKLSKEEEEEEL